MHWYGAAEYSVVSLTDMHVGSVLMARPMITGHYL